MIHRDDLNQYSYPSICTCTSYSTMCMVSMGMVAPVAQDVISHRAHKCNKMGNKDVNRTV